jgi:hypothetical protein
LGLRAGITFVERERERKKKKSTHIAYETGMLNKNGYNESEGWSYILVYKEALRN